MENKILKMLEVMVDSIQDNVVLGDNYKGVKALTHSYETMLKNIKLNNKDEIKILEYQKLQFDELIKKLEDDSIPKALSVSNYLEVNHLTTSLDRIYSIVKQLDNKTRHYYKEYNESVLIIGNVKFLENRSSFILSKCKELERYKLRNYEMIYTDYKNLTLMDKVSTDGIKGMRFDELIFDESVMSELELDCINQYIKPLINN